MHLGHQLVAQAACEELSLERLFFIPAALSPFKPDSEPAPAKSRLAMLRLALVGQACFEIDEQELHRGGISYTIDTVRSYAARFPKTELFYLIGADHAATLPQWREADALARSAEFVVIPRPGQTIAAPPAPFRLRTLRGFPLALSSSQIRARVQAGLAVQNLVPPGVNEFICNNRLYL